MHPTCLRLVCFRFNDYVKSFVAGMMEHMHADAHVHQRAYVRMCVGQTLRVEMYHLAALSILM